MPLGHISFSRVVRFDSPCCPGRAMVHPALSLGLYDRCFCRGGIWSGAYAAALTASRGDSPSLRPSVPRCRFLLVCPPCIRHVMKWASGALWAVVPVRLLHRHPYPRCFGVDRGVILSCAVIAVFTVPGFGVAPTSSLWLLLEGTILRYILPFLIVVFFGCIHHVYIV